MSFRRNTMWIAGILLCLGGCGSGHGGDFGFGPSRVSTIVGTVVNNTGSPISNAQVSLLTSSNQSQQTIATTTTTASGSFSFTNLAAGTYIVSASYTAQTGTKQTVLETVSVTGGATVSVPIELSSTVISNSKTGAVFGKVTLSNGVGVAGLTVNLQSQSNMALPTLTTVTDSTGSFSFPSVASGTWLASVSGTNIGHPRQQVTVVEAGAASQVDFTVFLTGSQ
jgi:uncharacterized GH25 family protein